MTNAQIYIIGGAMGAALLGWAVGWIFRFVQELISQDAPRHYGD